MAGAMNTNTSRALFLVLLVVLATPARADEPEGDPAARARALRSEGRYGDAEAALADATSDARVAAERAELFLETGRFEEAGEAAAAGGEDARCLALRAESRFRVGALAEAEAAIAAALERPPNLARARYLAGLLAREKGDRAAARAAFEWFFPYYAENDVTEPEDLTFVALASVRLAELQPDVAMDFQVTLNLLDSITKAHEDYLPAYIAKAALFLAVYQDQDAKKWLEKALRKNPRYPPALYWLAEQGAFRFLELPGVAKCEEALLTNPNLYEAREYIARARLGDGQYEEASSEIEQVLAVNPGRKQALGLRAVTAFLLGRTDEFEAGMAAARAVDATYAGGYVDLAEALEQQRRFQEAADWAKKATEVDPEDWRAFWALGRNLVHLANEKDARAALKESRRLDPFAHYAGNPFRENMEEVLGHLEEFVETRTPRFIYKIHVGENAVLARYYHRFMERSWAALTKKYGFTPEGPILTEIFHIHSDFAARTIGLPGIGALGACFGKVITLDSPSSRRPGEFVWASTAHHEFAHVITLQLSKGRVPRWFTEGLSVYEEREYTDWWDRDMDRRLFDAYANDELPPIEKFNQEFRGGDVLFAYYLGGMMCEFLAEEHGFPKIVEMLKAYAEDKQTPEVLRQVLGYGPEEYDARFKAWVGRQVAGYRLTPNWSRKTRKAMEDRVAKDPSDAEALITVAFAHFQGGNTVDAMNALGKALAAAPDDPRLMLLRGEIADRNGRTDKAKEWYGAFLAAGGDSFLCRAHLARILEGEKDFEGAIREYEAAKACFPREAGIYRELARLRRGAGDLDGAMAETAGFARLANTDTKSRLELADYYEGRGDWAALAEILTEVVWIYPLGEDSALPVHARLARALARIGNPEDAVTEFEVALELGVPREAEPDVRVDLAEAYLLLGRTREARYQARAALEIDPDFGRAVELLERNPGR